MRVAIGSDHAGFRLKSVVTEHLVEAGHEVDDLGTDSEEPVDYPAFCAAVGRAVARGDADVGIVLGGSGQGEQIAANKVHGVRAALCYDEYTARLARQHNDANVCSLGGRILGDEFALRDRRRLPRHRRSKAAATSPASSRSPRSSARSAVERARRHAARRHAGGGRAARGGARLPRGPAYAARARTAGCR